MSDPFRVPREFQAVESLEEGLRMLKEGAKTLASAMIWTRNQENIVNSHLSVYSDSTGSFYCWIPKDLNPQLIADEVAKTEDQECFFSVSLLRANIFFRSKFLGFDAGGMRFQVPTKVFKVQRRTDVRMPIPEAFIVKVEFSDPLLPEQRTTKKVLDISASGMAFEITEDETPHFPKGLILSDFLFTLKNKRFFFRAEVSNVRPLRLENQKGYAVGVKFLDLRAGDMQHIAGYIFEESRKYFSKFL